MTRDTRDGVLAPEECSYQTIPSCSLGSVRGQFWQVAVITLITRLLLIKKLSLKDDTMTLARHSLLPRSLVTMLCLTIILGLHCLMALTHQHSAALVTASLHTVIRTLDTASCCIMSPSSIMLTIAAPSTVKTVLSVLVSGVAATCDPAT